MAGELSAFEAPRDALKALHDWSRGWRNTVKVLALRRLRVQPKLGVIPGRDAVDDAATAILLPGVWERWEALTSWGRALHTLGWNVEFVPELDLQFGSLSKLAADLCEHLERRDLQDVLVVAHSKGGLVTKKAMTMEEGWRISKLISCGTPFDGAPIASLTPYALEMRSLVPWNEELQELRKDIEPNTRIVAIQAEWDQNVPPNPYLPGAQIATVPVHGHNALLTAPEVIALISLFAGWGTPRHW